MIISRTPFRVSFVGGGTDIADFYRRYPGRVLSTTIDKYVYVAVKPRFEKQIRVAYSINEDVEDTEKLKHTRVRAALAHFGIKKGGLEIISMADIPSRAGLGASSSFTVGLLNALIHFQNQNLSPRDLAEMACEIEINKVGEPIGKQDQYAAALGGFNQFTFKPDGRVEIEEIYLEPKIKADLADRLLFFYTGKTRDTGTVLSEQKRNISEEAKFAAMKRMSDIVPLFRKALEAGNFEALGELVHEGWLLKRGLASKISDSEIDELYEKARRAGAWGGKILGAGGGGFLMFIAPPERHADIRKALSVLEEAKFGFSEGGSRIIYNDERV